MSLPPPLDTSTPQERRAYVQHMWQCLHHCESCGKCQVLRGRDPETAYADYIEGRASYRDVTLALRQR